MPRERGGRGWWWLGAVAAVIGALVFFVMRAQRLPEGPQPVAWDAEPCAHCHMLIGAPGFAAQLVRKDGAVLNFDDPGCLLRHLADEQPEVHALWFHHAGEDRWIPGDAVAFRRVAESPMGWGFAAVGAHEPHDLDRATVTRLVLEEHATGAAPGARP